jgi:feruloyl esterase
MIGAFMLVGLLAAAAPCERLKSLAGPDMTITVAELVAAGPYAAGRGEQAVALPAHCRIAAALTPTPDSHIEMELWLPAENWNGKFLAVGNGGWAGTISLSAMASALKEGYATASNDTGHKGGSAQFALGHPEKLIDFGYRAMHEMAMKSKAIVSAFYDRGPRLSYYNGCSTGGRQGMMEAQRYPDDFDGIIAGAPVYNQIHLNESQVSLQVDLLREVSRVVPPNKVALFANAVIGACDALDGVKDGIVNDPARCTFDPATLLCKAGDAGDCLTAAQVASAKTAYTAVKTKTGEVVYPGHAPGFEAGWRMPTPGAPLNPLFADMPRYIGRQDAQWDVMSFDLDTDLALALKHAGFIEANDPDLAKFKARGGKLLLYHGWADPGPAPANTIRYYSDVIRTLGSKQDDWMRLFLLPGVGHCGGGPGPDQADFLGALERWRESGAAPDQIRASHVTNNHVDMTRPLCPYPQVAQYKGGGSTNDAANFVCKAPARVNASN